MGLTDDALNQREELDADFGPAMLVGAGLVLVGAVLARASLRSHDLAGDHDRVAPGTRRR